MRILVLNSGSSSIKFQLLAMTSVEVLVSGFVERIGEPQAHGEMVNDGQIERFDHRVADHRAGLELIQNMLSHSGRIEDFDRLDGIGHRVVHGGEAFHEPVRIDAEVMEGIASLSVLAPLHNPANLEGIRVAMALAPHVPQVAVFDTAFHQTLPKRAFHYAVPRHLYTEEGIRRYGFHGTSHAYVAKEAAAFLQVERGRFNGITLHLGNGASACAIQGGRSVDTSMGMTPLEGLVMGTRCGDLDPEILLYLIREKGMEAADLDTLLNRESGLRGLCGTNDMREILSQMEAGDDAAQLAFEVFVYRIRKYIGAYAVVLGRLDALVFTGGIGEHGVQVREKVCEGLGILGMEIDPERNRRIDGIGNVASGRVPILVIPTNEELEIALQTQGCITPLEGDV